MTDQIPPQFNGEVRARLSPDGTHSLIDIWTENGPVSFAIDTHEIVVLQRKLRDVQRAAEDRKAMINPRSDDGLHLEMNTATLVHQIGVSPIPNDDRIGVQFVTSAIPDSYVLTREIARDLIQRLRAQLYD
ncbi:MULTISPECIES: hypothetical protein [Salipiger]|uniref:Uncharacterized protein n=1 Tax=Salipiger profundus TaxID=1229727 RepID=A0A1U7DC88_9RHOB|nr:MULTISPECIES: hypothetical protein [Salipiger]ALF02044.1 hypothetical protein vBThpSP1_005 [Thiobacimonas phage vB_ThpS-P1]APX25743.1 hypothetical protein Ga0080559_TMP4947 [Salipiger profundus]GGA03703.1 hypothetical protein GCM10011326_13850 [Salipiger profundus]